MIDIDGIPPDLKGARCEELFCQQYWHQGRLEDEADIVLLKVGGMWHQLYFDGGVVHWRTQAGPPEPRHPTGDAVFAYPLVDLGSKYGVRNQIIADCLVTETEAGETVSLLFDRGATVALVNRGDCTDVVFRD